MKTSHQWLYHTYSRPRALPDTKPKLSSDFKNSTSFNPSSCVKSVLKSAPGMSGSAGYCFPSSLEPTSVYASTVSWI
ncbi:hypothetical protein TNCV_1896111 [Trichonephila clavipes]|nr:hypothetical protein TNCV_1896111 [Trichonephila clavipes]